MIRKSVNGIRETVTNDHDRRRPVVPAPLFSPNDDAALEKKLDWAIRIETSRLDQASGD